MQPSIAATPSRATITGAVVETDARGEFRFDVLRWPRADFVRFEVVALRAGLEQREWFGALAAGQTIEIATGDVSLEVRDRAGHLLGNRMFAADGLGDRFGVRIVGATDRFGILALTGIPRGAYALRPLGSPSDLAFPSPAFTVAHRGLRHAAVTAR